MKPTFAFLACSCLIATPAFAEGDWIVGLLADGGQSPYIGGEDSVDLIPYFAFETDRLHLGIDELSYELIDTDNLALSVMLDPRFAPDLPDTALFDGLTRDTAFELGLAATYEIGAASANLSVQHDVSGAHDGFAGELSFGYKAELGPIGLDMTAGLQFHDANLNNYLYGVSAAEVTADRAAFDMGDTVNPFAEVTALMQVSDHAFLLGEVKYTDLGKAIDSPLVDRDTVTDVTLGLLFQF